MGPTTKRASEGLFRQSTLNQRSIFGISGLVLAVPQPDISILLHSSIVTSSFAPTRPPFHSLRLNPYACTFLLLSLSKQNLVPHLASCLLSPSLSHLFLSLFFHRRCFVDLHLAIFALVAKLCRHVLHQQCLRMCNPNPASRSPRPQAGLKCT